MTPNARLHHIARAALCILAVILVSSTLAEFTWAQPPSGSPGVARLAAIEATAPLQDHSEQSVKSAIKTAVKTAMRGALAMGLPWIQILQTYVYLDMVSVQILATDKEPEAVEPGPGMDADPVSGRPFRLDL